MKKAILTLACGFLMSLPASAGLLLEPYIAMENSTLKSGVDGTNSGAIAIGGRVGYKAIVPVWVALDLSTSSGKFKYSVGETTFNRSNTYLTAGFDFPILFRVWAGMGLSNSLKTSAAGVDTTTSGGSHMKLGVGLNLIPLMSVNVEYFTAKPDKPTGFATYEETGMAIGVSVPFNL